jgi:hypothetical protein
MWTLRGECGVDVAVPGLAGETLEQRIERDPRGCGQAM